MAWKVNCSDYKINFKTSSFEKEGYNFLCFKGKAHIFAFGFFNGLLLDESNEVFFFLLNYYMILFAFKFL